MPKKAQAQVDRWNEKYPVGTPVNYYAITDPRRGEPAPFVTDGAAFLLRGHTPCVWLKGKAGAVALDALEVTKAAKKSAAAEKAPASSKEVSFDTFLGRAIRTEDGRASFADILKKLDEPSAENLLARLAVFMDQSDAFVVLAAASFLEGTLRLPRGRVHFEWDADTDGALLPFLAEMVKSGDALPPEGAE